MLLLRVWNNAIGMSVYGNSRHQTAIIIYFFNGDLYETFSSFFNRLINVKLRSKIKNAKRSENLI